MPRPHSQVVFDSRISKRATEADLSVSYKITEEELSFVTKLYQAYKIKGITKAPTIEMFLKDLVFSNSELFKKECNYADLYEKVLKMR
jgi:hypothetical protein